MMTIIIIIIIIEMMDYLILENHSVTMTPSIKCVCSCDLKPCLQDETKGGICIKIESSPQKNISLLQHGRRFFVYSSNMAAVTSCEHTLYRSFIAKVDELGGGTASGASEFQVMPGNWWIVQGKTTNAVGDKCSHKHN